MKGRRSTIKTSVSRLAFCRSWPPADSAAPWHRAQQILERARGLTSATPKLQPYGGISQRF
jgi:hypothetical protein